MYQISHNRKSEAHGPLSDHVLYWVYCGQHVLTQNDKQAETELYTLILHLLHMNMKKKFFTLVKIL